MRGGEAEKLPAAYFIMRARRMHCEPEPCSHGSAQTPADACRGGLQRENALTASGLQVDGIEGFETEPQTSFCSCGGLCAMRAGRPRTAGCGLGGVGLQGFGGRGGRGLASTSATPPATSTARRLREGSALGSVRVCAPSHRTLRGRTGAAPGALCACRKRPPGVSPPRARAHFPSRGGPPLDYN